MQRTWDIRSGADFGRAISEIRHEQSLTQYELAERAALSRDYVAQIEAGRSVSLLEKTLRLLRRLGARVTISFDTDDADGG